MSLKYRNANGLETPVAGLNGTSGELVPSVALMQSGTTNLPQQNAHSQTDNLTATFTTPMPDTDYTVVFDTLTGNQGYRVLQLRNKTVNGFTFSAFNADVGVATATSIKWTAFKLMTDTIHQADAAHISQNTANFAPAFSDVVSYAVGDYVTYNNVLYRCTTVHTAGVWVAGHFTVVTVGGELKEIPVQIKAISISGNQTRTMAFSVNPNKSYTYSIQWYSDTDGYHSFARTVRNMSSSDYDGTGVIKLQWTMSDNTATLSVQNTGVHNATLTVFVTMIQ